MVQSHSSEKRNIRHKEKAYDAVKPIGRPTGLMVKICHARLREKEKVGRIRDERMVELIGDAGGTKKAKRIINSPDQKQSSYGAAMFRGAGEGVTKKGGASG